MLEIDDEDSDDERAMFVDRNQQGITEYVRAIHQKINHPPEQSPPQRSFAMEKSKDRIIVDDFFGRKTKLW